MDKALLEALLSCKKEGLQSNTGNFKPSAWDTVVPAVKEAAAGQEVTEEQCRNCWKEKQQPLREFTRHANQLSGWTFDRSRGTYVSAPDVMDSYFQNHQCFAVFRDRGPDFQNLLQELLGGELVTAEYVRTADSLPDEVRSSDISRRHRSKRPRL
ncbi:hypothetical protein VTN49DRAFT_4912 [Thermomyces lanuginosus]|uniref:uncharacterized protein n=1 Tax=Thermomyces lanuginosus TaxID=5541 RepID=UPI0037436BEA